MLPTTEPNAAATVQGLLDAVQELGPTFEAASREAEDGRRLPPRIVEAMRSAGLFWMKTPRELGGSELDPIAFVDVLETIAYHDASAAWATMVGNGTTGTMAGRLPEAGAREAFAEGAPLPVFAGQYVPRGRAVPVDGGYRVTGRWTFSSGILHADWVVGGAKVEGTDEVVLVATPKSRATVYDTWYVAGLQGTGSNDFSLEDEFVPASQVVRLDGEAVRGGALFRQPIPTFLSNELPPIAIGVARRALDDMARMAAGTARQIGGASLGNRAVFQKTLGTAEAKWVAARLLHRDAVRIGWEAALEGRLLDEATGAALRARHTLAVEMCTELVAELFRYGGGRVLALDNSMQRHYRTLIAATQHVYLTEENYELAGRARLDHLSA